MFKVLIDTSAYEAERHRFSGAVFDGLTALAAEEKIKILYSPVIVSEIEDHIATSVIQSVNSIMTSVRKCDRIFSADMGEASIFLVDGASLKENVIQYRKSLVEDFFNQVGAEQVDIDININEIMSDYFSRKPPFGEGKKKSEFPDAFILHSLVGKYKEKLSHLCVISGDEGWKDYFSAYPEVKFFQTIGAFTDFINSDYDSELSEALHLAFASKFKAINAQIKSYIEADEFHLSDEWIDPEIDLDASTIRVQLKNPELLSVSSAAAEWELEASVSFKLIVSAVDPDSFFKDDDTKQWIALGQLHYEVLVRNTVQISVETVFERSDVQGTFELKEVFIPSYITDVDDSECLITNLFPNEGEGFAD